jgi:HAD superfamily hydrolase (TIGR01549 family)
VSFIVAAVGFDFGFTLVDHVWDPTDCMLGALEAAGVSVDAQLIAAAQPDDAALRSLLAAAQGSHDWNHILNEWYRDWAEQIGATAEVAYRAAVGASKRYQRSRNWSACPGADELLVHCATLRLPVGILSTWGPNLDAIVSSLGWGHLVRTTIGSSRAGVAKPNRIAFRRLCEGLKREPADVLYVGDDPMIDYDGATAAGLQAVLVRSSPDPTRRTVSSLSELVGLVKGGDH